MRNLMVNVLGVLAVLCVVLGILSLFRHSRQGEATSKAIGVSAAYLAGAGVFSTGVMLAAGVDVLASVCALGIMIAFIVLYWGANTLNLRLVQKGPLNVMRKIIGSIRRK